MTLGPDGAPGAGGLHLHRAPRADLLVDALADVLRTPQDDPFATELVIVPARGVERWVSQRLSHVLGAARGGAGADGVCAGVEFRAPRSIVAEIVGGDRDDVWQPDHLVWPLLGVIDASLGEPWCAALTRHLGASHEPGADDDLRAGRRYSVAHRLARLFAAYAIQRPALLHEWEAGRDTDGAGGAVDADLAWQAEVWRRLVSAVGEPSPVQRHRAVVEALRADPATSSLPPRLSLFGHTRIPLTEVELLAALAQHRRVDLWLPHPSDALWNALAARLEPDERAVPRSADTSHTVVEHPLLASLGRDLRELQRTLTGATSTSAALDIARRRPATLLGHLQHDLEAARVPDRPREPVPGDRSIQVHACHGAARQVEVLREVVLGLLADDPTLEPRDVVIMCPDVESYAPLLEAAFGLGGTLASSTWHPGQQLQVRLADRSLVQTNPLLGVVGRLLDLAGGRIEASAVLDLAAGAPVRRRFGFSDDDLETMSRWVRSAGVRWAFDAEHREPFGLREYPQNTWRFGLDRLLAGVAVSADAQQYFGTALPFDDVGSSDVDLVGRLAELLARLQDVTDRLTGTRPVAEWVAALRDGLDLLTAVGWGEEWQAHQAERELAALDVRPGTASLDLRLPDVRALMGERLSGRPTRANFRTGSITICTMVPMRSVPHRVVCLLGLDDGTFPRAGSVDGDDVLARRPLTGERDVRSEDRQLLLDAVMAATEHLVITYAGADEVSGRSRPPAVPLGELLDALDLTVRGAGHAVVTQHPLQAFDVRNFRPGALGSPGVFSFDPAARDAARRSREPQVAAPRIADLDLPALPPDDVDLAELGAFLRHPVREFLRRRLDLEVFESDDEVLDTMPVELDGLGTWGVGERMLRDRLHGVPAGDAVHMEWRRGILPPGRLGWRTAQQVSGTVESIAAMAVGSRDGRGGEARDVDVDLGGGRRLRGTVADVFGDRVVTVSYSSIGPRHLLDAWVSLLALTASEPDTQWTAGAVGRKGTGADRVVLAGVDETTARTALSDLVALRDLGMCHPLRLPLKTGHAAHRYSLGAAAKEWGGTFAERDDRLHAMVWGAAAPLDVLTAPPVDTALVSLAARVWTPLLARVVHG
jgi:exodeoxyribonuclease V gamma subunit